VDKTANARRLRQERTDAERKLWSILRRRKLDGWKFRRQVPIDRYFADFACMEARLVIELDGGQHSEQIEYDEGRTKVLEACGFQVLRFWNSQVLTSSDGVVQTILHELNLARP
jgi:very-short-patch-repair endonuclease